jgi:hypothetical protein
MVIEWPMGTPVRMADATAHNVGLVGLVVGIVHGLGEVYYLVQFDPGFLGTIVPARCLERVADGRRP